MQQRYTSRRRCFTNFIYYIFGICSKRSVSSNFYKIHINLKDIVYADYTDFITSDEFIVNIILNEAPSILEKWHLKTNISK
ncbi:MAG: hypothetical protein RL065_1519, partial [Bacteroidota bacterium]